MLTCSRSCPTTNATNDSGPQSSASNCGRIVRSPRTETDRARTSALPRRPRRARVLQKAIAIAEHAERMRTAIAEAIDSTPRPETRGRLDEFAEALTRGMPYRVQVECPHRRSRSSMARCKLVRRQSPGRRRERSGRPGHRGGFAHDSVRLLVVSDGDRRPEGLVWIGHWAAFRGDQPTQSSTYRPRDLAARLKQSLSCDNTGARYWD